MITPDFFATMRDPDRSQDGASTTATDDGGQTRDDHQRRAGGPRVPRSGSDRQADQLLRARSNDSQDLKAHRRRGAATSDSRDPATRAGPEFYLPMAQAAGRRPGTGCSARYASWRGPTAIRAALVKPLNAAVMARIDRDLPLFDVRTMDQRLADDAGDGAVQHAAAVAARRRRAGARRERHLRRHRLSSSASGRRRSASGWRSARRRAAS